MRRLWLSMATLAVLATAACAPQSSTPIVATAAFSTKPPLAATLAQLPTQAQPTLAQPTQAQPTLVPISTSAPASCTVQSGLIQQPNPTEAALYAPVTEADWVEGPASAKVTILDYSDFQ